MAKQKMEFNIVGAVEPVGGRLAARIIEVLRRVPDGQLLTCEALAPLVGYAPDYMRSRGSNLPKTYVVRRGRRNLYGNPKTIQAYRQHHGLSAQ